MRTVWKYVVDPEIELPKAAEILHVGYDGEGKICLWALVYPDYAERGITSKRKFKILGTGHESVLNTDQHIGSIV